MNRYCQEEYIAKEIVIELRMLQRGEDQINFGSEHIVKNKRKEHIKKSQELNYPSRKTYSGVEVSSSCLEVLHLAFIQSLTDKAIADTMNVSERTVRNYWNKLQDALGIFSTPGKNIRTQTGKRAREEGLISITSSRANQIIN